MLEGIIDLHIHTSPDRRPRRLDDVALAKLAEREGAAGVVLKGHHASTVLRAKAAQCLVTGIRVMGGLVLNEVAGGLSPAAVHEACTAGARIIWMPTLDAANHRRHEGKSGGIEVASGGTLLPAAGEILRIIADHDIALATGHLSPLEIRLVAEGAVKAGIRRIIVNHPEHRVTGLSVAEQKALVRDLPVYFERCYAQPIGDGRYSLNLAANLAAINSVGSDSTVLATDSGQMENAPWDEAWRNILAHHSRHGIAAVALERMTRINPGFLSGMTDG